MTICNHACLCIVFMSATSIRILIALSTVLLTLWSQWSVVPGESQLANEWLRDHFIRMRLADVPEKRIAVIDIDEDSLAAVGPWPWPRSRMADLAENLLLAYGAKAIAFDIVFPEKADQDGDAHLAMLGRTNPIVFAQAFDYAMRTTPLHVGKISGDVPVRSGRETVSATGYIGNHAGLAQSTALGNIGMLPDADGMVRRLPLFTRYDGRHFPTLSLALLGCCDHSIDGLQQQDGYWRVPYARPWSAYTFVPAADILNLSAPRDMIEGRLVLIGSSSLGLSDRVSTPLATSTPGVLVHAAALTHFLDRQPQPGSSILANSGRMAAVLYSVIVALMVIFTLPRLSAIANVALLLGSSLLWIGMAYWLSGHDPSFSTTGPIAANLLLLAVAVPFDWQLAQRRSRYLLGTLQQYVAKSVVNELLRSDLADPLAPRQCHVTTLIADMEGYTGQVESLSVIEAAQLTRDFLDCLTRPVLERQGTLDKYTGDGLVAFWGAPLPISDHADLALDAAKQILLEVQQLSAARKEKGLAPLRVRIGIESGIAMAGDFGTRFRSVYTAVGDSVNVASRLEDFARDLPYNIIVGEGTVNLARRHEFIRIREVVLRGKGKSTVLYTVAL